MTYVPFDVAMASYKQGYKVGVEYKGKRYDSIETETGIISFSREVMEKGNWFIIE
jgi:hypothetical protein